MDKLIKLLFNIDNKISNIPFQILLFIFLAYGILHLVWIQLGFMMWCILWLMFAEKNWGNPLNDHHFTFLGLLKGLNYSLLFGPISIFLHFLLKK